jgi:AcrR family transcriptional regulator
MSRPRGRPRDADADERILAATYDVVSSVGYENLTVDEIVARAGVSKATLYRRWDTKEELVIRCLQARAAQENPPPTGDWRTDIEQAVESMITLVNTPAGRAMVAVTAAAYGNIDLSVLYTRDDPDGPVRTLREALVEGIECGELRADLDVDLMMDLLVAAIPFRMIVLNERVPAGLSKQIVDVVIDGARVTA